MQNFKKKHLVNAILLGALATASTTSHTSDVDVYKAATQGAPSILLMLDTSGSMGISSLVLPKNNQYGSPGDVTSSICKQEMVQEEGVTIPEWQYDAVDYRTHVTVKGVPNTPNPTYGKTSFYNEIKIGTEYIEYYMRGCTVKDTNTQKHDPDNIQFDRLSKLKDAILTLLASQDLADNTKIGLANFSARTDVKIFNFGLNLVDGHSGAILVPVAELSPAQRQKIAKELAGFVSLDTTTNEKGDKVTRVRDGRTISELSLTNNSFSDAVLKYKRVSSGTPTVHAYAEAAAYMMGTGTGKRNNWNYWLERSKENGSPTGNSFKSVQYVYDGYSIMRNPGNAVSASEKMGYQDKTAYFLCTQANRTQQGLLWNGTTFAWDSKMYPSTVTQCVNRYQGWKGSATSNDPLSKIKEHSTSVRVNLPDPNAMRIKSPTAISLRNDKRSASSFYNVRENTLTMRDATETVYSADNPSSRTGHFIYQNNVLIGQVLETTINGNVYEYFVDFRRENKRSVLYATVVVGSKTYYVHQTHSEWSGRRDDDIFLFDQSSNLDMGQAYAVFRDGYPLRNNKTLGIVREYEFTGLDIIKADGTRDTAFFSPNSVKGKRYSNTEDARWQAWKAYVDMPEGSRMVDANGNGGWLRLYNEPMDIEPIVGGVHANGESGGFGLFVYRANPFSLNGGDGGTSGTNNLTPDDMVGGMAYSAPDTKLNETTYKQGGSTSDCDGNGIYFLTDGAPNSTQDSMARTIMNHSLTANYAINSKPTNGLVSPQLKANLFAGETGGWEYIGEYAKKLRDKNSNPAGMSIRTAVVGFGSSFESAAGGSCDSVTNLDAKNACKWGSDEYGGGGFYYANNAEDIKKSIIDFVSKVSTTVEPVSTGSPTIPADSFNPTQAPMVAYYGSFTPRPNDATQLWLGNMNKYNISDSEIVGSTDTTTARTALFGTDGKLNAAVRGLWAGGVLENLKLQKTAGETEYARKIYTDRRATGLTNSNFENSATLQQVTEGTLFDDGNLKNDPNKNYWLNILGYDINVNDTADKDSLPTTVLRQLGAVMHSNPLLLTQEGELKVVLKKDDEGRETGERVIQSDGRKDYLLYGSTQGLLHVIDNETGEEKFAFVPNEMMRTQKEALLHEGKSTGGVKSLFYGIDAPWTTYTKYVVDGDDAEKLTVNNRNKQFNEDDPSSLATAGVQWVYGGLRMGGRSYYALDLTDIDTPKLRFHIDPANNTVYANGSSKTYTALQYMGQSWSKPTIANVKWKGTTKLVMFVGGGYDAGGDDGNGIFENGVRKEYAGYEQPDYNQENSRGGGVYMFDAINGDLLWWGSANVNSSTEATADPNLAETRHEDLKYSVVSQINAIDRDEDGLADHLYFGDLGGQAFRIDIDNRANITKSGGFVKRIERLFNEHQANGASPRFYEMPSVSAYNVLNQVRAVVAFNSGNRSSPLAGTNRKSDSTNEVTTSAVDALYVAYDYNATRTNLYTADATTENAWSKPTTWFDYNKREGVAFNEATTRGWKYTYSTTAGEMKGINELETLGAFLYASVYEKDKNPDGSSSNESTSCNAGVRGSSRTLRYCLPTGLCTAQMHGFSSENATENKPDTTSGKSGLVTSTIGGKKTNSVGLVDSGLNKPNCQTNPSHIDCAETPLSGKINQLRWYESR